MQTYKQQLTQFHVLHSVLFNSTIITETNKCFQFHSRYNNIIKKSPACFEPHWSTARQCTDVYRCTNIEQLCTGVPTLHSCVQVHQLCTAVYRCTNFAQLCTGVPTLNSCVQVHQLCMTVYRCANLARLCTGVPTLHSCVQVYQPCTAVYRCTNLAQLGVL